VNPEDVVRCAFCHRSCFKDEAVRVKGTEQWKCILCVEEDALNELYEPERQSQDVQTETRRNKS
jgi:hypothetical protein